MKIKKFDFNDGLGFGVIMTLVLIIQILWLAEAYTIATIAKAIIGAQTSVADGVLVLESNTKAMILPTVLDVQLIPSPSPGMMVYVNKAGAKRLAVYNGRKWSFWKP